MAEPYADLAPYALARDHRLHGVRRGALVVGVLASAACALGAFSTPAQFFRSYLVAYVFCLGIALGSMAILMLQYVTGGLWGAVLRRVLEAASRTLPLLVVLFLPLLLGLHDLYEWTHTDAVAHDEILAHKSAYLNVSFFVVRAALYFAVWLTFSAFLNRWSIDTDGRFDPGSERRLQFLGRGGLVVYTLTMTFAAIDWMMSLEPHWFSHIYGIMIIGGQVLTAFAFAIPILAAVSDRAPMSAIVGPDQFHDLGKLMLAFVMLWAYFSFSQYLIIWSGNLPEETSWYWNRLGGGWEWVGIGLILFHFAIPFVVLLSSRVKRNPAALAVVAGTLLGVRLLDLFWLVRPAFSPRALTVHWLDPVTVLAAGGLWLAFYLHQLGRRPLLPVGDPALPVDEAVA